ncbi:MAG TPA: hypothetical protein VHH88_07485 [Verrucomicrobiae bacterium]|nr:hypothetical protein [Verrucomicrobiae bacterium]
MLPTAMDADEREVCDYLRSWKDQFVSGKEICKRAGGKWRAREDPNWAVPVLLRLVEKGIIESDSNGHYRLLPEEQEARKKVWVSPQNKKLLEEAGRAFDELTNTPEIRDLDQE